MDVYIYTDGKLINGDDADIRLEITPSENKILCDDHEKLEVMGPDGKPRLNMRVKDGFDGTNFTLEVIDRIKAYSRLYHNGSGRVYRVSEGKRIDITDLIL